MEEGKKSKEGIGRTICTGSANHVTWRLTWSFTRAKLSRVYLTLPGFTSLPSTLGKQGMHIAI